MFKICNKLLLLLNFALGLRQLSFIRGVGGYFEAGHQVYPISLGCPIQKVICCLPELGFFSALMVGRVPDTKNTSYFIYFIVSFSSNTLT